MSNERERFESGGGQHPELELLLRRAGGLLDAGTAAEIDAHLEACALCRLELRRLERFDELDDDADAARAADWESAAPRLDAAWRDDIRPAIRGSGGARRRIPRWLGPLAAAAAVAGVMLVAGVPGLRDLEPGDRDTMRGVDTAPALVGAAPVGEIGAAPAVFSWTAERDFDAFVLEVFTAELGTVLHLEELTTTRVELPDSLRAAFAAGTTYFWHVEGREGLTATEASSSVWFRIVPPADE